MTNFQMFITTLLLYFIIVSLVVAIWGAIETIIRTRKAIRRAKRFKNRKF